MRRTPAVYTEPGTCNKTSPLANSTSIVDELVNVSTLYELGRVAVVVVRLVVVEVIGIVVEVIVVVEVVVAAGGVVVVVDVVVVVVVFRATQKGVLVQRVEQ